MKEKKIKKLDKKIKNLNEKIQYFFKKNYDEYISTSNFHKKIYTQSGEIDILKTFAAEIEYLWVENSNLKDKAKTCLIDQRETESKIKDFLSKYKESLDKMEINLPEKKLLRDFYHFNGYTIKWQKEEDSDKIVIKEEIKVYKYYKRKIININLRDFYNYISMIEKELHRVYEINLENTKEKQERNKEKELLKYLGLKNKKEINHPKLGIDGLVDDLIKKND